MTSELKSPARKLIAPRVQEERAAGSLYRQVSSHDEDPPQAATSPLGPATPRSMPSAPRVKRASPIRDASSARAAVDARVGNWIDDLRSLLTVASIVLAVVIAARTVQTVWDAPSSADAVEPAAPTVATSAPHFEKAFKSKPIQDFELGERIVGHNPLREQVDLVEPDDATWFKISFEMRQENRLRLWVDLLRPPEWAEDLKVRLGGTVHLDLPEMGAVGDATVTDISPCPHIDAGDGPVVTGKFKRESDGRNVVELRLEGQAEPTGVTDNHPYWSVDRQRFIAVGGLRQGELVDTEFGPRRIESVTSCHYEGLLHNLETTEHVFRVGSLGTLVHNACAAKLRSAMKTAGVYGDAGTAAHHIVARNAASAAEARGILSKFGVDLDSHWNGVFLPRNKQLSKARGMIHEGLDSKAYHEAIVDRLKKAESGGRSAVLRELQKIRNDLLNGTFGP